MSTSDVQQAGDLADQLGERVRQEEGDLATIYSALEQAAISYRQAGGDLQEAVPGGSASLGFRGSRPDGKSIWSCYATVLHDELCQSEGELHKQVKSGFAASGATIVTLIISILGLPVAAALVVAPIAGSILGLGVEAFCKRTAGDK